MAPAPGHSMAVRLDGAPPSGYTFGMKTAISVPDEIFNDAEKLAKRLKISRSQLYRLALTDYVARHSPEAVTEALDRVCADLDTGSEPLVSAAARRVLERTEW